MLTDIIDWLPKVITAGASDDDMEISSLELPIIEAAKTVTKVYCNLIPIHTNLDLKMTTDVGDTRCSDKLHVM